MGSKPTGGAIRVSARLVVLAALLLSAVSLSAQDRPSVTMELSDTLLTPGQRLTVELFVPGADPDELRLQLPELPPRLTLLGEPLLTESRRLVGSSVLSGTLIIVQLQAGGAGRTELRPFLIETLSGERLETETVLLEISTDGTAAGVPFDLAWRIAERDLIVGESVPVYLEMRNLLDLRYPEAISVESPATGVFEEVRGLGEVSSRQVGETTLYAVPVAAFLLTPTEIGTVRLPQASVTLGELSRSSEAVTLLVSEPTNPAASGAVGRFGFAADFSQEEGELRDTLLVTLTVSGAGNLPFLSFPEVTLNNLIELERQEEGRTVATSEGYEGERVLTLRLSPGEGSEASVRVASFDYFDPERGELNFVPGPSRSYELPGTTGAAVEEELSRQLVLVSPEEILLESERFSHRESTAYLLFLIGPGVLLVVAVSILLQNRRPATTAVLALLLLLSATLGRAQEDQLLSQLRRGAELFEEERYAEAVELYRGLSQEYPYNAGIHYNLGVTAYLAGSRAEAIFGLREGARLAPESPGNRELLQQVEAEYGLERQIEVPRFLDPDTTLIGLLLLFNVGLPLVVLLPLRAKGQRVIAASIFLILTLLGALVFGQAYRLENRDSGVVAAGEAQVLRIPEPDADAWLSLPEGTAVRVELRHQGFVLVRTGLGVEGWLRAEELLIPARNRDGVTENG